MALCFNCNSKISSGARQCPHCQQAFVLQSEQTTYSLDAILGKGGFGIVYRARDGSGKSWAIKKNTETDLEARRQFEREADTLSMLAHSNLASVTDYFVFPQPNGEQYLVMEYVHGQDLSEWMAQNDIATEQQVLHWMGQVLRAVDYLHTRPRPVIHRDIKPDNIRLLPNMQTVKLVDFGIIKIGGASAPTKNAARCVSPGYSPLEQYSATERTGSYSDVYSLGATMYMLLTGEIPPDAVDRTQSTITLKPVCALNPNVSEQTQQVIHKALATNTSFRYQTAGEMLQALMIGASPPESGERRPPPDPRSYPTDPPPPAEQLTIESSETRDGDWVNTLHWIPNKLPGVQYLIARKYRSKPLSPTDGQKLAVVSKNIYDDKNPEVGLPTFYAIYAIRNGVPSETAPIYKAQMRVADVTDLQTARQGRRVKLTWTPPPNVSKISVRKSRYDYPQSPLDGDEVPLIDKQQAIDKLPSNSVIFYTVYCYFRDDTRGIYIPTVKGARIKVS
jgi:serine/threonine protein kinase